MRESFVPFANNMQLPQYNILGQTLSIGNVSGEVRSFMVASCEQWALGTKKKKKKPHRSGLARVRSCVEHCRFGN
jgi:hypothetical protein